VKARLGDRSLFPTLAPAIYLNHAGVSPLSLPVRAAALALLDDQASRGAEAVARSLALRARLRQALARLVGARPEEVGLTSGASAGVQAVALCFPWRRGDRVVLFEGEFPANVTPWQRAAALFGLELAWLPLTGFADGSGDGLLRLEEELGRGARLVAVSAVQFRTGLRMPLAEMAALCAPRGAALFVDAIQALGATPLDAPALGLDYLASGAHKWLMGLEGAGFLWVKPGRELLPHLAGWLSHQDPVAFLTRGPGHLRYDRPLRTDAQLLEGGSAAAVAQAALLCAVELLLELGIPAIHAHANAWLDGLEPLLAARGLVSLRAPHAAGRSSFFTARPPPGASAPRLREALQARGVALAIPDGLLRFAPHWPNALDEPARVAAALDEALEEALER
jgi:selenocysteine lyase/cysteine desulfurase